MFGIMATDQPPRCCGALFHMCNRGVARVCDTAVSVNSRPAPIRFRLVAHTGKIALCWRFVRFGKRVLLTCEACFVRCSFHRGVFV